ncbi:MAG: hypothetical protein J7M26_01740, partial [Armatimonadetes bacterium]|nr:hypothetical protein [Armatimonadota bacterium]
MSKMKKLICRQVERILATSRREDWSADERAAIERHLAECSHCRQFAAEMEMLARTMAGSPREKVPSDFTSGVLSRLQEREADRPTVVVHRPARTPTLLWGWGWRPALA